MSVHVMMDFSVKYVVLHLQGANAKITDPVNIFLNIL